MKFTERKVFKCLWVKKYVDIYLLRPDTIPQAIEEVVDIVLLRPANLPQIIAKDIIVVMLVEVDLGHKRPSTIPIAIKEQ